jgi:hypothetical protein
LLPFLILIIYRFAPIYNLAHQRCFFLQVLLSISSIVGMAGLVLFALLEYGHLFLSLSKLLEETSTLLQVQSLHFLKSFFIIIIWILPVQACWW